MDTEERIKPENKFVSVDGQKLRYIEEGSGPSVLFLHGASLGSSADVFLRNLGPFAKAGFRAVAFDLGARLIFEDRFGATHVPTKSLFVSPTDHLMTVAMTANFMAAIEDLAHETRTPFSHPPQHEECRANSAPVQELQQSVGIAFNSHRIPAPIIRSNDVRKRLHVEIILDIDCQRVHHIEPQRAPEPKRITLKLSKMIWRSNTGDICLM